MRSKTTNVLQLANTVLKNIQNKKLFKQEQDLLIAFSGGQDSAFCLLVLFLLKKRPSFVWSRKTLPDLSKSYQTKKMLVKQALTQPTYLCLDENKDKEKKQTNSTRQAILLQHLLQENKRLCEKTKIDYNCLTSFPITDCALLWCNHFWQKSAFFTMEHVSRLAFCKNYTAHFLAPVTKVLSEQCARNWRHKGMQRSSLFVCKKIFQCKCALKAGACVEETELIQRIDFCINSVSGKHDFPPNRVNTSIRFLQPFLHELCVNTVFIPHLRNTTEHNKTQTCFTTASGQLISSQSETNSVLASTNHVKCNDAINSLPSFKQLSVQGHTKSDRAEAILFNVIKGAGINGISTLQWKHIFYSPPNSNTIFYPISFDFCKEIRIVCLQSFFINTFKQKNTAKINRSSLGVTFVLLNRLKPRFAPLRYFNTTQVWHNSFTPKKVKDSNELKLNFFPRNYQAKTFYYQLKHKNRKIL